MKGVLLYFAFLLYFISALPSSQKKTYMVNYSPRTNAEIKYYLKDGFIEIRGTYFELFNEDKERIDYGHLSCNVIAGIEKNWAPFVTDEYDVEAHEELDDINAPRRIIGANPTVANQPNRLAVASTAVPTVLPSDESSEQDDEPMPSVHSSDGSSNNEDDGCPVPTLPSSDSSSSSSSSSDDGFRIKNLREQEIHVNNFIRSHTVKELRDFSKISFCYYCEQLIYSTLAVHYDPHHTKCRNRFQTLDDAHRAEKKSLAWKSNVLQNSIITGAVIRDLLRRSTPEETARYLDGAIVFGHLVIHIQRAEFDEVRRHMTRL